MEEESTKDTENVSGKGNFIDLSMDTEKISSPSNVDEEDVPDDFFDDFSNQDFMAGLDVVDAWDNDDEGNKSVNTEDHASTVKKEEGTSRRSNAKSSRNARRGRSRSPYRSSRFHLSNSSTENNSRYRNRDGSSRDASKSKDLSDRLKRRRDPEKTKRDIQKDKAKCAKDQKAKIISEKLKVVETGLVPPGTEMEIDLVELIPEQQNSTNKELKSAKNDEQKRRSFRRSRSFNNDRARKRYENLNRRDSPIEYRRSRSLRRSRTRSPLRAKRSERGKYIGDDICLDRRASRHASRGLSQVSEREMWLRKRDYRKRGRDRRRSRSPFGDSFLKELDQRLKVDAEKNSFLKEIRDKLNESSSFKPAPVFPQQMNYNPVGPVPPPMPGPVPPPMPIQPQYYFTPPMVPPPQYDLQFFIGQPEIPYTAPIVTGLPTYPMADMVSGPIEAMHFSQTALLPVSIRQSPPPISDDGVNPGKNIVLDTQQPNSTEIQKESDKEEINKLFEDKKISLSDFLSITAKSADGSTPVSIQKKRKVITLCQDAIKELRGESAVNGFFCRHTPKVADKMQDNKNQSPLRKIRIVRFQFTTPAKGVDKSIFSSTLNRLLANIGLETEVTRTSSPKLSPRPLISPKVTLDTLPVQKVLPPYEARKSIAGKTYPILEVKFQMKRTQTDPHKCHICEIRSARSFVDQDIQCMQNLSCDMGTQVTEEDFKRSSSNPVGILKNQSLSHLTPAQLLAQTSGNKIEGEERFHGEPMAPSPPNISSEKHKTRPSLPLNDNIAKRANIDRSPVFKYKNRNFPNKFDVEYDNRTRNTFRNDWEVNRDRCFGDFPQNFGPNFPERFCNQNQFAGIDTRDNRSNVSPFSDVHNRFTVHNPQGDSFSNYEHVDERYFCDPPDYIIHGPPEGRRF